MTVGTCDLLRGSSWACRYFEEGSVLLFLLAVSHPLDVLWKVLCPSSKSEAWDCRGRHWSQFILQSEVHVET